MVNITFSFFANLVDHPIKEIVTWYQILHFTTIFIVVSLFGFAFLCGCMFVGLSSCSAYSPFQQFKISRLRQQREVMPYFRAIHPNTATV
uniref:Uncharacterized protein n=1 Tax=Panagrolaimus sp. JU765 TaxID=591449 RepID=A0AC34QNZ4_9BILA